MEAIYHDIGTALNGIISLAECIKKEALSPRGVQYVDHLIASTQALTNALRYFLENPADAPVSRAAFNLKSCLESVINLVQPRAVAKNIALKVDGVDTLSEIITDQNRLFCIVFELISNAVKFTPTGSVTLNAFIKKQLLVIRIKDTGIGIPLDEQENIFRQHYRAATAKHISGSGLGLTCVKQHIEALSGTILVESVTHQGTTVTCEIPIQLAEKRAFSHAVKVLLVEDHQVAADILKSFLAELQCIAVIAENADIAFQLMSEHQYDIALIDLHLPNDNDAILLVKKIQKYYPETRLIGMTAWKNNALSQRFMCAGVEAIYQKPLSKMQLAELLGERIAS